ncbi:hypothetical protein [Bradyrhizobium sp. WD16]|uniref:hypothetical protein n=1 Tax=Bradyrhizobium sp. WD16 TaxID=1521768 RepID=UPI0020A2B466|nr:hypothetical protein [Bradyrhizobium sp. WD16]
MRTLMIVWALILMSLAPAPAQTVPPSRSPDPCQPIGRTEDGKLVYSLKCNTVPAPPKPSPAAAEASAPAPAPDDDDKGGLFGRAPSFVRPTADPRAAGAGPSQPR